MSATLNDAQVPGRNTRALLTPRKTQATKPTASLALAAKKKEILGAELAKLENDLQFRTELLERLKLRHEQLLTANGHLQEQNRLRRQKLSSLQSALHETNLLTSEQTRPLRGSLSTVVSAVDQQRDEMKELETSADKIAIISSLIQGLSLRRVVLEHECMAMEETTSRQVSTVNSTYLALREAQETWNALREDIAATAFSCEMEQHEIEHVKAHIHISSQVIQDERIHIQHSTAALDDCNRRIDELHDTTITYQAMAEEDISQLQYSLNEQRRALQVQERLLDRNGATCPKDEEIEQVSKALSLKLGKLNEQITSEKYHAREATLLVKQEKKIISILKCNIRSKESQLLWLQRQQVHHDNEYNQLVAAASARENEYNEFANSYSLQSDNLEDQLNVLSETVAVVDNELSACISNAAAVEHEIKAKQEFLQNHFKVLESKENEVLHLQTLLNDVIKNTTKITKAVSNQNERNDQLQKQIVSYEMQNEDMISSEHMIEAATTVCEEQSSILELNLEEKRNFSNKAIGEFRAKFFSSFDRDQIIHAQNILSVEVARMRMKEQHVHDDFAKKIQVKSRMVESQYNERMLHLTAKLRDASMQKENEYRALLVILTEKEVEAKAKKQIRGSVSQTSLQSLQLEKHLSTGTETLYKMTKDHEIDNLLIDVVQASTQTDQVAEEMHSTSCVDETIQDDSASCEHNHVEQNTRPNEVSPEVQIGVNVTKMFDDIYHCDAAIDDQFDLVQASPQRSQVNAEIRRGREINMILTSPDTMVTQSHITDASKRPKKSTAARLRGPKPSDNNRQFNEASCFVPVAAKKRSTVSKARATRRPGSKITKVSKKVYEANTEIRPGLNANESSLSISEKMRSGLKATSTHDKTSRHNEMQQQPPFTKSKEVDVVPKACVAKKTTARRLTTSRMTKSRPQAASQSVDWFADDTFSFD